MAGAITPVQSPQLTRGRPGPPLPRLRRTNSKRKARSLIGASHEWNGCIRPGEGPRGMRQAAICRTSQQILSQCAAEPPQGVGGKAEKISCRRRFLWVCRTLTGTCEDKDCFNARGPGSCSGEGRGDWKVSGHSWSKKHIGRENFQ